MTETLAAFADSLNYGSRTDLNFKWLHQLESEDQAAFLAHLLRETMRAVDSGDVGALAEMIQEAQVRAYRSDQRARAPMTAASVRRDLSSAPLAVVTASGHFVKTDDPAPLGVSGMTAEEAATRVTDFLRSAPVLSDIPIGTPDEALGVLHPGYDPEPARLDPGVVFPGRILRELTEEGRIGRLVDPFFSFIGAASRKRMINDTGPRWAEHIASLGTEAVLLVAVCPVCHLTIGHLARALEARGMTTVVVFIEAFEHVADQLGLPRVLITSHPLGRTIGAPHDGRGQREVIEAALELFAVDAPARHHLDRGYR